MEDYPFQATHRHCDMHLVPKAAGECQPHPGRELWLPPAQLYGAAGHVHHDIPVDSRALELCL